LAENFTVCSPFLYRLIHYFAYFCGAIIPHKCRRSKGKVWGHLVPEISKNSGNSACLTAGRSATGSAFELEIRDFLGVLAVSTVNNLDLTV
jgi:hypothetical protein